MRRTQALILGLAAAAAISVGPADTFQQSSAQAAVRKQVTSDYTLLRRAPASYVIGTAYRNWTVDVHGDQNNGYRWGRVYGDLNTCLWTYSGALSGTAPVADSCGAATTMPTSQFTNGQIGGGTSDGASVTTVAGSGCQTWDGAHITGYGNVRPWNVPASASSPVNGQVAIGQTALWRYVSRDGKFVMIRDPRGGSTDGIGQQSWYFIPRGCLPANLS
ncbi:hypothetical protein C8250_042720 [Streptomyces sp. So13.3]|uniref:hypothetical protein n=1 Tax=Streptomyces sp. So13.3 TaxID=2136173 RepID=UPI001105ED36|nr:hypothetical protein [Streptomyces sp. So13.3]QNA77594.1 hypothetical protein C8250_042720 [Streptomyces sp. So13.3]